MSEATGRLRVAVTPELRSLLFEPSSEQRPDWKVDLEQITLVDLAHVVMLVERGLMTGDVGARLLDGILTLRRQDFAPLERRSRPRGVYLAYEGYLIEKFGEHVGGVLQTGRSRNDLNATCTKLRLRDPYQRLLSTLIWLGVVLLNRARRYSDVVMPAYTHYQPAVPITYGHYLLGLAAALSREADALLQAGEGLEVCPLGAGAVGGTLPIDPARTARLLGFAEPSINSLDAVASRDHVLRLLAAAAVLGVPIDRAAHDLLLWSTAEFGLLRMPDDLVGSSSMMPQKRNPFVLEHVKGKSAACLGAFLTAATAMHGTPFTNSISVGTEAIRDVWGCLDSLRQSLTILRMVFSRAAPQPAVMLKRAQDGYTTATALAERLSARGTPFRVAHNEVGAAILAVLEGGSPSVATQLFGDHKLSPALDPSAVCQAMDFGGGPGPTSFATGLHRVYESWLASRAALSRRTAEWRRAERGLFAAVDALLKRSPSSETKKAAQYQ